MRIVKTAKRADGMLTASFAYGPFLLTRSNETGRWELTAPKEIEHGDLDQLAEIVAWARTLKPIGSADVPLEIIESGTGGVAATDDTVREAQDLSAERGTFGAAFADGGFLHPQGGEEWPTYTFESDEALLKAAMADPLQHDARGLWRVLQDRIGTVEGEPVPLAAPAGYTWDMWREHQKKEQEAHDKARAPFSAALARVQEIAFGPSFSTDELQKTVYLEGMAVTPPKKPPQ